ncbi:MAG TPA: HNH endonuclease signature motif containing protein [Terriglobales bacterium]|nr:HNH endonuclease signature motif containing protein [Terriglobales bacterium]
MSTRDGAPYEDAVQENGKIIIYEGHDAPRRRTGPDPKSIDQPEFQPNGRRTQNGLFIEAVRAFKEGRSLPEKVRVFEKIRDGIWVYNGIFELIDGWAERSGSRRIFKFKFRVSEDTPISPISPFSMDSDRVIPSVVKLEVWKRDKGRCVKCGSNQNLHFDHIIPYSLGGSSKDAKNIQILCAKHNLEKHDRVE